MMASSHGPLFWTPRLLAIGVALFLGIFALDTFGEGRGFWAALPGFLMHLMPTFVLLATAALGWRRAWLGGLAFLALAALYAIWARQHPAWIAIIAGPLALVGALYLLSWWRQRTSPATG